MPRILIEIHEGQIVRNLLENNLLGMLVERGAEVLVVTPGARIPSFIERHGRAGVTFRAIAGNTTFPRLEGYEHAIGEWLSRKGYAVLRQMIWKRLGEPMAANRALVESELLDSWNPDVVVSTHLSQLYGRCLVAAARRRGIPTVGNLMSWDNAWKGLRVRPDLLTCWSENNRAEICEIGGYDCADVQVIGAPAFDAYLAADSQWPRERVCDQLGLDPGRPILLFATLGQFKQQIDETSPLEVLLRAIDSEEISGRPQIVVRMHPWSREAYFKSLLDHPGVVVSRYENYVPGLTWTPTREEAMLAGNLLRHSAVCISPGSTMCIETAIFDTPTVVAVFNEYMPEVFEEYFKQLWLNQHFRRLQSNDWVPIARNASEMVAAVNKAMADKNWYSEGRRRIREEFLGPLDGCATRRLADVILGAVNGAH